MLPFHVRNKGKSNFKNDLVTHCPVINEPFIILKIQLMLHSNFQKRLQSKAVLS